MLHNDPKGRAAFFAFFQEIVNSSKKEYDARVLVSLMGSGDTQISDIKARANAVTSYARLHQAWDILATFTNKLDASHDNTSNPSNTDNTNSADNASDTGSTSYYPST